MSAQRLRLFVERIERLIEERRAIGGDIRDVFSEAKGEGYDAATIRRLIARRRMEPHQRFEADEHLATYEAALDCGPGEPQPSIVQTRPDAASIALELLTAEVVALEDSDQAIALVGHVTAILDLREEIRALRAQERDRLASAKGDGFEAKQVSVTVRWFEKVAKHGEDAMRAGEATFHLYRGTVEGQQAQSGMTTERDQALFQRFAGPDPAQVKNNKRKKAVSDALAAIRAQRANEGGGIVK
ncbi:DUF2312 domain-containing protein [Sphingomonas sp. Leaf4]|uniref:DUF2312 domain-containing protein n=1 Tax=Sphingomonas sp. Leaf4 TaxID=2876553 RepID=UPI002E7A6908|nr:DUF2312 domain-containing protein [Sphingomonas sp. Leaf4]